MQRRVGVRTQIENLTFELMNSQNKHFKNTNILQNSE
jgi:hypothetical protein